MTEVLLDSYSEANWSGCGEVLKEIQPSIAGTSSAGQSFTTPNDGISYHLSSCKFYLQKFGAPVAIANAVLYAHAGTYGVDGKPTGDPVAISDNYQVSALPAWPDAPQLITFTFSGANQYKMSPNTQYVIQIQITSKTTLDADNYVSPFEDCAAPTHSGNMSRHFQGNWATTAGEDTLFYVYGIVVNYTLTIEAAPMSNGTTDPAAGAHVYAEDTVVPITATPNHKQEFSFFIANGVQSWTNPLTVTMTEDTTVTPHFGSAMFGNVIRNLEKKNVERDNPFDGDVFEAGIFGRTPLDDVLANLEK